MLRVLVCFANLFIGCHSGCHFTSFHCVATAKPVSRWSARLIAVASSSLTTCRFQPDFFALFRVLNRSSRHYFLSKIIYRCAFSAVKTLYCEVLGGAEWPQKVTQRGETVTGPVTLQNWNGDISTLEPSDKSEKRKSEMSH